MEVAVLQDKTGSLSPNLWGGSPPGLLLRGTLESPRAHPVPGGDQGIGAAVLLLQEREAGAWLPPCLMPLSHQLSLQLGLPLSEGWKGRRSTKKGQDFSSSFQHISTCLPVRRNVRRKRRGRRREVTLKKTWPCHALCAGVLNCYGTDCQGHGCVTVTSVGEAGLSSREKGCGAGAYHANTS